MQLTPKTITLKKENERQKYLDQVWVLLQKAYENVEGGLLFESQLDLLASTCLWKIVVSSNKVIAVTVYKAKKGLKLVAMSACKECKKVSIKMLANIIKQDLKKCWMELSEKAEEFVLKIVGMEYALSNTSVAKVLEKEIILCEDGIHYIRKIKHLKKQKILLGTPQI